jgi:hypothetical protein
VGRWTRAASEPRTRGNRAGLKKVTDTWDRNPPIRIPLGVTETHRSRWYAPKALYGELLVEDQKIREHLDKRLNRTPPNAAVSDIHIERTREELKVIIRTARPGLVIGPKGAEVDRLTEELQYMTGRKVSISIIEIKNPDMDAQLVAEASPSSSRSGCQLPPRRQDAGRAGDAGRRQGRQDRDLRPPGRRGDEPPPRRPPRARCP